MLACVVVEIETKSGLKGHGFTSITDEEAVAPAISALARPALLGEDARDRERLFERLYWIMTPRGQTGYAGHAMSAVDLALWDLLGKMTGLPCWRLLGGARSSVPLYVTFGFGGLDRETLAAAGRHLAQAGATGLKMVVGHHGLQKRNEGADLPAILAEDVERVRAVREAIGPEPRLYVDANCSLDFHSARWLAERLRDYDIAFFEEPLRDNDAARMAEFRRLTGVPVAAGQNEGQLWRFEALLAAEAVDVLQPNAVICGGFTVATKAAALAAGRNVTLANGGAFPFHNGHLHAGLAAGGLVEWHLAAVSMCRVLFKGLPDANPGLTTLALPETPGLGFELDLDALKSAAAQPGSAGRNKG
ncbi:MAG: mandelate racemase/muconate lactonizing enzyme family protein [Devosia sp.]